MNNKDFDAFMQSLPPGSIPVASFAAISGMEPPQTETKVQAPQPKASDNFFDAPNYRGENQQDLTEDEKRAEMTERSDIDELTSKQNLSSGIASIGAGLTLTIGVSSMAGTSGAGLGLGIGLVGCLIYGTQAVNGKKTGIVRLGAMTIGTRYAGLQLWNNYSQNNAVNEVNHSVELYMVKQPRTDISLGQVATWLMYGVMAIALIKFLVAPKTKQQKTTTTNPLNF